MALKEEDENVVVSFQTYWRLIKPSGGACFVILLQIIMVFFIVCNIGANYAMQRWAYTDQDKQLDEFNFYFTIILSLSIGMGVFIFFRVLLLVLAQLKTSQFIHNWLI